MGSHRCACQDRFLEQERFRCSNSSCSSSSSSSSSSSICRACLASILVYRLRYKLRCVTPPPMVPKWFDDPHLLIGRKIVLKLPRHWRSCCRSLNSKLF
jgi:hypothetical protein